MEFGRRETLVRARWRVYGEWGVSAYGRVGVSAFGRMGVWAYGRIGVSAYGRFEGVGARWDEIRMGPMRPMGLMGNRRRIHPHGAGRADVALLSRPYNDHLGHPIV
jgi:hypothetical protein